MNKTKNISKIYILAFIGIILLYYLLSGISLYSIILCASFIFTLMLLMLYKPSSGGIDIFEPIYFFAGTIILVFFIAPMAWIARGQVATNHGYGFEVMHMLPLATLYVNLGFLAFFAGYSGKTTISFKSKKRKKIKGFSIKKIAWIILIISMAGALLYDRSIGISVRDIFTYFKSVSTDREVELSMSAFNFLSLCHNSLISSYLVLFFKEKKNGAMIYILGVIIALMLLVSGNRYRLLIFLLAPLVIYFLNKHKRPSMRLILVAVIGMFLVTSMVGITRTAFKVGSAVENVSFDSLIEAFSYNIDVFSAFYRIVDFMPKHLGFRLGISYVEIILQFIPRAIWPDKPFTTMTTVMNAAYGKFASSGPSYTLFGEHYVEFGIVGIIIALFIIGKVFKSLWVRTIKEDNILYNVEYAVIFIYILQLVTRGSTKSKLFELLFFCLPFFLFKRCEKE